MDGIVITRSILKESVAQIFKYETLNYLYTLKSKSKFSLWI